MNQAFSYRVLKFFTLQFFVITRNVKISSIQTKIVSYNIEYTKIKGKQYKSIFDANQGRIYGGKGHKAIPPPG